MSISALIILILCALCLYVAKHVAYLYQNGTLCEKLEEAAKKALRFTLKGVVAIGGFLLALFQFSFVRELGFALLPADVIAKIRILMELVLEANSVYTAIQMAVCAMLFAVEFSLIFSFVGLFVTKPVVIPQTLECSRMDKELATEHYAEVEIPRADRKLFLNFANLRI